jgi:outer membrane protein W
MTMKTFRTSGWRYIVILAAAIVTISSGAFAQDGQGREVNRMGKWDVYLLGQNLHSQQIDYKTNSGVVPITMDSTLMGGLGFGYHLTQNWGWRFEVALGYPTFSGKGAASGTSRNASLQTGMLNVDWILLPRRITPYFTGGIGWQYIYAQTSNVGTVTTYWDPWWGYTTGVAYPSHTETDFVWTAGLGIRWEVTDFFFLKVSADSNWLNYSQGNGTTNQIRYGLAIGATY